MDHMHNLGTISSDPKPNKVVQELKVMPQLKKAVIRTVSMRVQVERLKESDLKSEGTGIRTLSSLSRLRQGPSYSPNNLVSQSATSKQWSVQVWKLLGKIYSMYYVNNA